MLSNSLRSLTGGSAFQVATAATAAMTQAACRNNNNNNNTQSLTLTRSYNSYRPRRRKATLIRGEGLGPDVTNSVLQAFTAMGVPIDWECFDWVPSKTLDMDDPIPQELKNSIFRNKYVLKGPLGSNPSPNCPPPDVILAREFNLFAHVVPIKSLDAVPTRHDDVDMVVIRENTEGEYSGLEHIVHDGVVQSMKVITNVASRRIAEFAFDYAKKNGRKKVTAVHKANIMKAADGLFLKNCREVAGRYRRKIDYDEMIIDNCCMQLVSNPEQFDVMVTGNLYGNIVSEAASGLVGGVGLTPGFNGGDSISVYEQGCRHTGHDIAHKNIANPVAMLLSGVFMLNDMGLNPYATVLKDAVEKTLASKDPSVLTRDIKGCHGSTKSFTQAVIDNIDFDALDGVDSSSSSSSDDDEQ